MAEDHSSGSSIPEGDQPPPHYADQMGDDPQQREAVSPVSGVPHRWQSNNPVQQFIRGLQLSQHRCMLVGEAVEEHTCTL